MSILQQVVDEFVNLNKPEALTDKTDKRASVSSVSDWFSHIDINNSDFESDELPIAAQMLEIMDMRQKCRIPSHYTSKTTCKHCGPVPIWQGCPPKVLGCPWCFNRHQGLPIPTSEP